MVNFEDLPNETDSIINAERMNLLQEIQTASSTLASGTVITNGYAVTLPNSLKYQVGNNSLQVMLSGCMLVKGTDYNEVDSGDSTGTQIKFIRSTSDESWTLSQAETLIFIIKGVSQD